MRQVGKTVETHLRHCARRNLRPGTIAKKRDILGRLEVFLAGRDVKILRASVDDLRDFVDRPSQGAAARANEVAHLRAFFRWATEEELVKVDPSVRLERPRLQRNLPRPIRDEDLRRALELAPRHQIRPWLYLAAYAGLRASDIAGLSAENIRLESDPAMMALESKGGKMRAVPVSPILADVLTTCDLPRHGFLFPARTRSGHVAPHFVSHRCNAYLHDLGIDDTFHSLRHWCATNVYKATKDLLAVQEILGHADTRTARLYTWLDPESTVRAVGLLPEMGLRPSVLSTNPTQ